MKDRSARVLAIIALVFMAGFVTTLIMTLVDTSMLHGSIGFLALGFGVLTLIIFVALKADGRGYSITKINNELEMEKLRREEEERLAKEKEESKEQQESSEAQPAENDQNIKE